MSYVPGLTLDFRARLREAVRNAWNSPEGFMIRDQLEAVAGEYGEALRQWAETSGMKSAYKSIAERTGIRYQYLRVWGKARPTTRR